MLKLGVAKYIALQEKENECVSLQKNASEHKVQGAAHEAAHRSKCLFIFKRQFSTIYHLGVGGGGGVYMYIIHTSVWDI